MNRFENYPRLTLTILVLFFIAIILIGFEWILSSIYSGDLSYRQNDRYVVRALRMREWRPTLNKKFTAPEVRHNDSIGPIQSSYQLRIDEQGFIWPSLIHDKPDFEIVFLGGSTTESLYVRPTFRFPYVVGRRLEQQTGLSINSINAGKSGNHTLHSVLNYIGKVVERRPKYVVLMHASNDIGILSGYKTYWNPSAQGVLVDEMNMRVGGPIDSVVQQIINNTLPHTFYLILNGIEVAKHKMGRLFSNAKATELRTENTMENVSNNEQDKRRQFRIYFEPALRSFVRLARVWGSEPILVTQVLVNTKKTNLDNRQGAILSKEQIARGNFDAAQFNSLQEYANELIRFVARDENTKLIDLVRARNWTSDDVYDGLHFTEKGSNYVAEIVTRELANMIDKDLQRLN